MRGSLATQRAGYAQTEAADRAHRRAVSLAALPGLRDVWEAFGHTLAPVDRESLKQTIQLLAAEAQS